jgi:hypothetical protein
MDVMRHGRFARFTASFTLMMFTFVFYLSPTGSAVAQEIEQEAPIQLSGTADQKMNQGLVKVQEFAAEKAARTTQRLADESGLLDSILELFGLSQLTLEDVDDLRTLSTLLAEQHTQALANFDQVNAELIARNLPEVIMQRQRDTVAAYQASYQEMQKKLETLVMAENLEAQQAAATSLDNMMKGQKLKRSHQKTDPNNLPFGTPDASKTREPATTPLELSSLTGISPLPQGTLVAANVITPEMLGQPGGPVAEDLTETPDVQFTEAIKAKALELEEDPVKIYNWVRNNIEFIPSYGSIQGADYTLLHGKGNAFDTASLLIALLRAANIPARYAYGTVDVPAEKVMNWVGGVDVPEAAQQLLGQGGIPNVALVDGGRITLIRMEHIWVDVWVDYFPSRAARHAVGDQWIPLDASFKQYEFTEGEDLENNVPFDAQGLVDQITQTATIDESAGYVQGIDQADVEAALAAYQQQVEDSINSQNPEATVGDVLGTQQVIVQEFRQLAADLPYRLVARTNNYSELPDNLRHKYRLTVQQSTGGILGGFFSDVLGQTFNLSEIAGSLLSVSYTPATGADELALLSNVPQASGEQSSTFEDLRQTIPGYLINMSAEFNLDGESIVTAGSIPMGTELNYRSELYTPGLGWKSTDANGIAGEYRAIGLDLQGIPDGQYEEIRGALENLDRRIEQGDVETLTKHDLTGLILQANIMTYFAINDVTNALQSRSAGVVDFRLPSYGYFVTTLSPQYFYGTPRNVTFSGVTMDVPFLRSQSFSANIDRQLWINYNRAKGIRSSYMEHWVPEQYFGTESSPVQGVSAVKILSTAMAEGQRVYSLTPQNLSGLGEIVIDSDSRREILSALNAGKEVTVHQFPVTISGWTGSGYMVLDPETGAGGYLISGGANGGSIADEFIAKFLNFFNMYGLSLDASEVIGLILFGSIPKSWVGASPLLGSTNPLTSLLRGLGFKFAKHALLRVFLIPAVTLAGVFIGVFNFTIIIQALIYAAK